jgi:hypothetical protein
MRRAGVTFLASPPNLAATMTATSAPFPRSGRKGTLAVDGIQMRTMPREHSIDVCLCEVFRMPAHDGGAADTRPASANLQGRCYGAAARILHRSLLM